MAVSTIPTLEVGTLSVATSFTAPAASISNTEISATAAIASSKVVGQRLVSYSDDSISSTVQAMTRIIYTANGPAVVRKVYIRNETAPTGGDLDYTVNITKAADLSSSFSTILSGAIASPADNTKADGTVSSSALIDGDTLQLVVAVSGSTGTQALGLSVFVVIEETTS